VLRHRLEEGLQFAAPTLERESLPPYLQKRRWFGAKDQALQSAHIANLAPLDLEHDMFLGEIEVKTAAGPSRWQLPLGIAWDDEPAGALPSQLALAPLRQGRRVGLLAAAVPLGSLPRRRHAGGHGRWRPHRVSGRRDRVRTDGRQGRGAAPARRCRGAVADRRAVEQLADRR